MNSAFPLMANSGAAAASSTAKISAHTPAMTTPGANTLRMKVTKLNFYYGKNHALHNVSMDVATNRRDGDDRTFGLRQVHAVAHAEPHA